MIDELEEAVADVVALLLAISAERLGIDRGRRGPCNTRPPQCRSARHVGVVINRKQWGRPFTIRGCTPGP
jgi:hypothetical protein